jgi:TolA-binding protein
MTRKHRGFPHTFSGAMIRFFSSSFCSCRNTTLTPYCANIVWVVLIVCSVSMTSCLAPVRPQYFKTAKVERPQPESADEESSASPEQTGGMTTPQRTKATADGGADNAEIDLSRPANTTPKRKLSKKQQEEESANLDTAPENLLTPKRKTGAKSMPSSTKKANDPAPNNSSTNTNKGMNSSTQFSMALTAFDAGNYASAQQAFETLSRTLASNDSLKYEADFMVAESQLMQTEYEKGMQRLQALLRSPATPPGVAERALLRQGQVHCLQGNSTKAQESFRQFRQRFPRSRYAKLADCSAVRGS